MITPLQGFSAADIGAFRTNVAPRPVSTTPGAAPISEGAFLDTLKGAMGQVQQLQGDASKQVADLISGKGQDIHSAMIAVEKADLSFQMMMQVRNKIVSAYQEISRMPF
jgi:flagellar hook-basal body complex protein FliE